MCYTVFVDEEQNFFFIKKKNHFNSDLNGSANILRKAFPDAFKYCQPDFTNVEIIRNIEQYHILRNQDMQCEGRYCISKARARRMKKVLPLG